MLIYLLLREKKRLISFIFSYFLNKYKSISVKICCCRSIEEEKKTIHIVVEIQESETAFLKASSHLNDAKRILLRRDFFSSSNK
jgi:hypothetical protein